MYHYRLFNEDGSEAGEATYAVPINPGEDHPPGRRQEAPRPGRSS
jgi:hypothetical protein